MTFLEFVDAHPILTVILAMLAVSGLASFRPIVINIRNRE